MGEYTFTIFRKLLCTTLILSLLWPDLAKCMDEENSPQQPSFIPSHLKEEIFDQKEDLPFTKESKLPTILKEEKTSSEDLRHEDNPENNLEKLHVSEEITNKEEGSSENKIPSEDTNTSSHESKEKEGKNTETVVPQTTSLPKENESSKKIKKEENNPLQESIEIFEEGEEGGSGGKTVKFIEAVEEDEKFSEKTKSFLSYFKKRIIDGWPTWKQVVGAIGGGVIGVGVGYGMTDIIYSEVLEAILSGIPIIYSRFLNKFLFFLCSSGPIFMFGMTSALDATMREVSALMDWGSADQTLFLSQKKIYQKNSKARKFLFYGTSFFASLLPIYYLIGPSYAFIEEYTPKDLTYNLVILALLSIPQIVDTVFSYGKSLNDAAEKRIQKNNFQQYLSTLQSNKKIKIEAYRQSYLKFLKKLMWILHGLPNDKVQDVYDKIFLVKKLSLQEEDVEKKETLSTLQLLLQIYQDYDDEINPTASLKLKKRWASACGWIGALFASAGRHFVFCYSVNGLFYVYHFNVNDGLTATPYLPAVVRWPLSIVFGGIIGATVQGYFEKENLAKSYYNITGGKIVTEPQCWKPLRVLNKVWNYLIQGPLYTLPYVFTLFEALTTCTFSNSTPTCSFNIPFYLILTMGVPFFIADAFNNATYFNESSGKWVSAINRLLSYTPLVKYLTGYKKDKLIEITHGFREKMRDLKPEVVKDLDTYFRKKIPNLFRSRTNEENSEKEEREPLLKSKKEITFYDHGSIDDMTLSNNHLLFKEQKGSMFSSCWRGLGRCYQKIPSLNTCWKGVKKGFTFLFSSCRKRSKDRELNIYHTDDDDFEREKLIN